MRHPPSGRVGRRRPGRVNQREARKHDMRCKYRLNEMTTACNSVHSPALEGQPSRREGWESRTSPGASLLHPSHDVKPYETVARRRGVAAVLALFFSGMLLATAYSQSQYPYSRTPRTGRPASAPMQPIGGFVRNPYANSNARTVRSGVPIGGLNRHSYFQSSGASRGNSLGYRPPPKPFAGAKPPRGVITLEQVGRIEVSRGLWRY